VPKLKGLIVGMLVACGVASAVVEVEVDWTQLKDIEKTSRGYKALKWDPFLISAPLKTPLTGETPYLALTVESSRPVIGQLWWIKAGQDWDGNRCVDVHIAAGESTVYVSLLALGYFEPFDTFRFDPGNDAGVEFNIKEIKAMGASELPQEELAKMVNFHAYTSKLHYRPGERIEYGARLKAVDYPYRRSSKILYVDLFDEAGSKVASEVQHYGIAELYNIKELFGVIDTDGPLTPGKYTLKVRSVDQLNGYTLASEHIFGVQSEDDVLVYETPFKFVKDFSIIQDHNGLWHIFSITGELYKGHDWYPEGHERTFSHGTSPDLKNWTYHEPVLSISDQEYPDENGMFEDRNIWAPHVIRHGDTYYMFYTSINSHVSQSISLATSKDLFNWVKYEGNPVATLEGVEWADWHRDSWADGRDPAVLVDGDKFYMYFTAHLKPEEGKMDGAVVVMESDDLYHWSKPQVAVNFKHALESPQVWKGGDKYYMLTSATGHGQWISDNPVTGWNPADFARPEIPDFEKQVTSTGSYAEEAVRMDDGALIMASCTFRYWGNSIYLFKVIEDETGKPIGYESPFKLK